MSEALCQCKADLIAMQCGKCGNCNLYGPADDLSICLPNSAHNVCFECMSTFELWGPCSFCERAAVIIMGHSSDSADDSENSKHAKKTNWENSVVMPR